MEENSGLTSCRGNLRPPLSGEWRRRLNGGAERENDWAMIRYVDPEVTVVNGEGDGSDLDRALCKDMIYPAGPSGAIHGEVGDPVAELVGAKAQSGGWIPPGSFRCSVINLCQKSLVLLGDSASFVVTLISRAGSLGNRSRGIGKKTSNGRMSSGTRYEGVFASTNAFAIVRSCQLYSSL